ncbi:MAG: HAMP domain-containing protein [Deltaproteobacteria bacterium]|nr:MAG: HAMP domain-containing protein [Deltaproteobacteria bacterium]
MKLWHKYALALFIAAVLPVAVAAWQIAGSGATEVAESAREYHTATADVALGAVRALVETATAEARTLGAALAQPAASMDDRLRAARALLTGAQRLENYVVYSPEGELVFPMKAAGATEGEDTAVDVPSPESLPEAVRKVAMDKGVAFSEVITDAKGALYLPLTVRIPKPDGELYAFGWSAVPLANLSAMVSELSERRFGSGSDFVSLVDRQLRVIATANASMLGKSLAGTGPLSGVNDGGIFAKDLAHTVEFTTAAGEERIGAIVPFVDLGWGVIVEQPRDVVYAAVGRVWSSALLVGALFALAALILGTLAGRRLSAPIVGLSQAAGRIAGGDFEVRVPVKTKDEVGALAGSFNSMAEQLTDTIAQLQETTRAKERMQTELDIGRDIQMSMVPRDFPAFPERREFDIHAALEPAYEVGGDFYDFFLVDDDTLCVVVADVSGKGVPAALFMAVTRTMVKAHASAEASTDEILSEVNDELAEGNDECMFVTVFLALVDLKTGAMRFTNAGHNPSYIKRKSGEMIRLDKLHGPVIAAMEDVPYGSADVALAPGDTLIMYTDGVNEAMNANKDLYSEERLARLLEAKQWTDANGAVKVVLDDVWAFQGDADQADDVTVVALRYNGPVAG